jgi:hypothetical protein
MFKTMMTLASCGLCLQLYSQQISIPVELVYKQFKDRLNWEGITFPTKLKEIKRFEKNNNIRVNVYGIDKDEKKKQKSLYL